MSSVEQAERGLSLAAQKAACRRYVLSRGWVLAGEYVDVFRGTSTARPGYVALLKDLHHLRANGAHVAVVVTRLDRFGRSFFERARYADELRELGVTLHAAAEGGAIPDLVGNLLAAVAEEEVRRISERRRDVCEFARASGWFYGGVPWGYRLRPATSSERADGALSSVVDVDTTAAPLVVDLFDRRAHGETVQSLGRWMQSLPKNVTAGRRMQDTTVRRMLGNSIYVARQHVGNADVLARPVAKWPALIDDGVWLQVQATFANGKAPRHARNGPPQLLSGLLRCPHCKALMEPVVGSARTRRRYRCVGSVEARGSPQSHYGVVAEAVEQVVVEKVDSVLREFRARHWRRPTSKEPPMPSHGELAIASAQETWARAAEAFVDGTLSRRSYQRARTLAERILARLPSTSTGAKVLPGPHVSADATAADATAASEMFVKVRDWREVLATGDAVEAGKVLRDLLDTVVASRTGVGHFSVELTWSAVGSSLIEAGAKAKFRNKSATGAGG